MGRGIKVPLLLAALGLTAPLEGCVVLPIVNHGELSADCEAVEFQLQGEVISEWHATVAPGQDYMLSLRAEDTDHPLHQVEIDVVDTTEGEQIANAREALTFTGPEGGQIVIYVDSKVGEWGNNLGTFTISLCEQ